MKKSNLTLIAFLLLLFALTSVMILTASLRQRTPEERAQAATGPATSPSPSILPCTPSLSDINKDCKSTIEDYALFLESYRKVLGF